MNEINLPEKARNVLKRIRKKYKVGFEPLRIRDVELNILQLRELENVLSGKDPFSDVSSFPFWVKLWEAALLLAESRDLLGEEDPFCKDVEGAVAASQRAVGDMAAFIEKSRVIEDY